MFIFVAKYIFMQILVLILFMSVGSFFVAQNQHSGPVAKRIEKELFIHNHKRVDPYFWMNQRDSKEVLNYLKEENNYADSYLKNHQDKIDTLLKEFEHRINPNEQTAPFVRNKKTYQIRNLEGKDYSLIYLINKKNETLFLDENQRAEGHSFYQLANWVPSPNNKMLALTEDFIGRRNYSLSVKYIDSGEFLKDSIGQTNGSVIWANDNKTLFYVKSDPQTLRDFQVYRHRLGEDVKKDVLVYQEDDETYSVSIEKSRSGDFIMLYSYSTLSSELRLINADKPEQADRVFLKREKGHLYSVEAHKKGFYILSNKDAKNNKLLFSKEIPINLKSCEVLISHDENLLLEEIHVFKKHLVLVERSNGLEKIRMINLKKKTEKYINSHEETYSINMGLNDDYNAKEFFYNYVSLSTPYTVYSFGFRNAEKKIWHQRLLKDKTFTPLNYESKRIWAIANDGTQIPVSIIYKKGIDLSKAPCLLYGYGSYGYTIPDYFSATRISLLDRGFVYALAHIRGGKYMGEEWYQNGKYKKKINTFTDFINVAEHLGNFSYCDKNSIYAQGGSAGGLLMGAIMNMAPYMWKGVIAQVPFVDVVTTMLDETIPLTTSEYDEWGNPNQLDYYTYMLKYSPYDNIRKMDYPSIYVTTGYHDSQVQYWEPAKWVAKIRAMRTNNKPFIFECSMDAGHGGASGRTNSRLEVAKLYAFILSIEESKK